MPERGWQCEEGSSNVESGAPRMYSRPTSGDPSAVEMCVSRAMDGIGNGTGRHLMGTT